MIVQFIGATTTETAPKVCCKIERHLYPKGIKITGNRYGASTSSAKKFHGGWNYTISPKQQTALTHLFLGGP
jgi:hypothetical protein